MEDWLCKVEEAMVTNLHKLSKVAILDYKQRSREQWVLLHSSQVSVRFSKCCLSSSLILNVRPRVDNQPSILTVFEMYRLIVYVR